MGFLQTGFDTTFKPRFPLVGHNGRILSEDWKDEPRSYMGVAAPGYPNYYMFLGPNSPIGNGPVLIGIEGMKRPLNRNKLPSLISKQPKPTTYAVISLGSSNKESSQSKSLRQQ